LYCYEQIEAVFHSIQVQHFPNTDAVKRQLTTGQPAHTAQTWKTYAQGCVQPGFDYFISRFRGQLSGTLAAFKAARLFLPQKIRNMQPVASEVDTLKAFPFLQDETLLTAMKSELPNYLASSSDVALDIDPLLWWKQHSSDLPNWTTAACLVFLVQPSSAAAERAFSILKQCFNHTQQSALQDLVEATVMLQFNHREV